MKNRCHTTIFKSTFQILHLNVRCVLEWPANSEKALPYNNFQKQITDFGNDEKIVLSVLQRSYPPYGCFLKLSETCFLEPNIASLDLFCCSAKVSSLRVTVPSSPFFEIFPPLP